MASGASRNRTGRASWFSPRMTGWSDAYLDDPVIKRGLELLGSALYQARCRAGLTQRGLEARCGVEQSTISRLENGKLSGIGLYRLARIIAALDGIDPAR